MISFFNNAFCLQWEKLPGARSRTELLMGDTPVWPAKPACHVPRCRWHE